ncbi:rho GTPase-activating protein 27 [Tachysurus ichikawai]
MVDYYSKVRLNCRPTTAVSLHPQVENEDLSAVYVNLPRIRQSIGSLSSASAWGVSEPPELNDTLLLGSRGWEVHTDEDSGKEYYYHPSTGRSTWDYPLSSLMESEVGTKELPVSPTPSLSPACSPTGGTKWTSDWEKVLDEKTGRHFFFNPVSGQSSWDPPDGLLTPPLSGNSLQDGLPPPLPEEDYPHEEDGPATPGTEDVLSFAGSSEYSLAHGKKALIPRACLDRSVPAGWTLNIDPDGVWIFTNDHTQEQWVKSLDDRGQTYYYLKDGSKSEWSLPELSAGLRQCTVGNGGTVGQDGLGSMRSWRNSTGSQDEKFPISHRRNASDSDMFGSPETLHNVSNLEKAGILNKTKISENGKKVRKNWAQSWTVLHGGVLIFHKDPKSNPTGTSSKINQIVPEFTVELKGATIGWAAKEKSSKKNVLELKSRTGTEYLIQYDTDSIINDWHKVITDTIRQIDMEQHHSEDDEEASEKSSSTESGDKRRLSNGRQLSTTSTSESDQKKVRNKLRKFLLKRPTLQSVKEKGYIRENVFGCHLQNLCAQEKTTVPSFVMKCIRTVEKRGLGVDGIYRVSGNLAVIQKLRFKADHEDLDLEEGPWDIHVITGALKLFFRELQEPLFPYSHFNSFVQGIKIPDYNSKISYIRDLVKSLPQYNRDTMEALFSHLRNPGDSSVLDRLMALEKMMLGTPERERLKLLKTVAQSRKEIQRLKEKQKELEEKAEMLDKLTGGQNGPKDEKDTASSLSLFKTDLLPLQRKQSVSARPKKQQAIVTPLQVSVQPLQDCAVVCKTSRTISKKNKHKTEISEGKENSGLEPVCEEEANWESRLDSSLLNQSKKKILQTLNSGSLKELKSLQLIGDKKAKLILGWREINGDFTQVEDLKKIEGITEKRFSSFIKANILSAMGK